MRILQTKKVFHISYRNILETRYVQIFAELTILVCTHTHTQMIIIIITTIIIEKLLQFSKCVYYKFFN
jgi:hypothetical protein